MSKSLKERGLRLFQQGKHEAALEFFGRARDSYKGIGNQLEEGECLNNLGVVYRYLGHYDLSRSSFETARCIFQEIEDQHREGQVLGNIGDLLEAQGLRDQSAGFYLEAVEIFEKARDFDKLSQTLVVFSRMRLKQGRLLEWIQLTARRLRGKPRRTLFDRLLLFVFSPWAGRSSLRLNA